MGCSTMGFLPVTYTNRHKTTPSICLLREEDKEVPLYRAHPLSPASPTSVCTKGVLGPTLAHIAKPPPNG